MLDLSKEELLYLRSLLIPEINILYGWIKVARKEDRGRLVFLQGERMELLSKIEAAQQRLAKTSIKEGLDKGGADG